MKRLLFLIALTFSMSVTFAQTQQGIVKTRGRLAANGTLIPGVRLSGATVNIQNSSSSVTGKNGTFSFAVPSGRFRLSDVRKQGYQLCDQDVLNKDHMYSANPFVVAMETPDEALADRLAAEKNIRRALQRQLQDKEDEIEALKEERKISDEQYHTLLQNLYDMQDKNDDLISEMVERYSAIDFDEMDDLQRQVAFFIQNGELTRADSLLNTKGSMAERSAELDRMDAAIRADSEELSRRQKAHVRSMEIKAKALEDFAADCYSHHEICLMKHENDSAAYWLELRASKDTLNREWQTDCGFFILNYLADYDRAQRYMQKAIDLLSNDPTCDDITRGAALANLADVYLKSDRYEEAISLYTEARELQPEDPISYAASTVGLANCYEFVGKIDEALRCAQEAYSAYQNGCDDPRLLCRIYSQLGESLCQHGDYDDGVKFLSLAVELMDSVESNDQIRQAIAYIQLAKTYNQLDIYDKSEELYLKALNICRKAYDDNHPTLSTIYNGLGVLYYSQSKYQEALDYMSKAKNVERNRHDDSSYARICFNISSIMSEMGNVTQAEPYITEALDIMLRIYGEDSPAMVSAYTHVGSFYFDSGDYDKASRYIEKNISIIKSTSGDMHPNLIGCYSYMGGISQATGNYEDALCWFQQVLDVTIQCYGEEHTKTAEAYANLGGICLILEKYDKALDLINKSLEINVSIHGEKYVGVAAAYNGLAQTYMAMGRDLDAIANFQKAIEIRKEIFGANSVKLKSLYTFMKQIYQKMGDSKNVELYDSLLKDIQQ